MRKKIVNFAHALGYPYRIKFGFLEGQCERVLQSLLNKFFVVKQSHRRRGGRVGGERDDVTSTQRCVSLNRITYYLIYLYLDLRIISGCCVYFANVSEPSSLQCSATSQNNTFSIKHFCIICTSRLCVSYCIGFLIRTPIANVWHLKYSALYCADPRCLKMS